MRLTLLLAVLAAAAYGETWKFDNLQSIGGHTVKVMGNPKVIDTPKGKAIEFDGVDDAIFLEVHPLAGATTFTWEAIFRPDKGGKAEQRIFHLQENGSETRMLFETRLVGDQWYLDAFVRSDAGNQALMEKTKLHPLGEWYAIAAVYDGKELSSYVNGVLQMKAALKFAPQKPGRTSLGVRINLKDYFKGAFREARMTKKALKSSQLLKP